MVVFTCNHCGDAVQKPKVEKHYVVKCRRAKDLTCIDCLKDFKGEEFSVHTSCVSEDQRYSAKGTEQKPMKGMQKQGDWVDIIQSCYDTEPSSKMPKLQTVFNAVLGQTNVPRKKSKFMNFITSSVGNRVDTDAAAEVFDLIQSYYVKQQNMKVGSVENEEKSIKTVEKGNKSVENVEKLSKSVENDEKSNKSVEKLNKSVENGEKSEKTVEKSNKSVENGEEKNGAGAINAETAAKNKKKSKKRKFSENRELKPDATDEKRTEAVLEDKPKEIAKNNKRKNKKSKMNKAKKLKLDDTSSEEKQKNISVALETTKMTSESVPLEKENNSPVQSGIGGVKKAKKNKNKHGMADLVKPNDVGSSNVQNGNDEAISSKSKKRRLKNKEKAEKKNRELENVPENVTVEKNKKNKTGKSTI